jgi:ribonuclease HI
VSKAATGVLDDVSRELAARGDSLSGAKVNLHTDSDWAMKSISGAYTNTGKYAELVPATRQQMVDSQRKHGCEIKLSKVAAHSGVAGNERADSLAGNAARAHGKGAAHRGRVEK